MKKKDENISITFIPVSRLLIYEFLTISIQYVILNNWLVVFGLTALFTSIIICSIYLKKIQISDSTVEIKYIINLFGKKNITLKFEDIISMKFVLRSTTYSEPRIIFQYSEGQMSFITYRIKRIRFLINKMKKNEVSTSIEANDFFKEKWLKL